MKIHTIACSLAAVLHICFWQSNCHAEIDWRPQRTHVFAVGVLEWQHHDIWRTMTNARQNRRDVQLVQYFTAAGVPQDRITYLQDKQATRARIQTELVNALSRTQPGELVIFYFTGHGFRDHQTRQVHFANYDAADGDTAWSVKAIFDTLEANFRGSHLLLMADCCYSGGLVDEMRARKSKLNCACLCSSHSHNSSTGQWTFSDALLAGFRGSPVVDMNGDGEIDFAEVGQYAELEMAFVEHQKSVYSNIHDFSSRWRVSRPAQRKAPRQGERVEAEWKGKWYRAEITAISGDQCRVHYVGFADSWDEWLQPNRIRPFNPPHFAEGAAIEARSPTDNKWYPAHVVRCWYGLTYVHYDGYPAEWNEWVNYDSVRLTAK